MASREKGISSSPSPAPTTTTENPDTANAVATSLANSLFDELGLGLRRGGVLGLRQQYSLNVGTTRGQHLQNRLNSYTIRSQQPPVGKYKTTHDYLMDVLDVVDNATQQRQESYRDTNQDFLRHANMLDELAGGRRTRPREMTSNDWSSNVATAFSNQAISQNLSNNSSSDSLSR